jgi:hypothetical protein
MILGLLDLWLATFAAARWQKCVGCSVQNLVSRLATGNEKIKR